MDYQDVVKDEFIPRCMAALNQLRADLITAGAKPGDIVVEMPDSNDLRFAFRATGKGNKTVTGYIELSTLGPPGHAIFTLWLDVNGTEITHSYTPGNVQDYTDDSGLTALLSKLSEVEAKMPEITVKARAALGL